MQNQANFIKTTNSLWIGDKSNSNSENGNNSCKYGGLEKWEKVWKIKKRFTKQNFFKYELN